MPVVSTAGGDPKGVRLVLLVVLLLAGMAGVLWMMGRVPYCTCGSLKLWHGSAFSSENSQHLFDWYTPSHVIHGLLLYLATALLMPGRSLGARLVAALTVEAAWEIVENTDLVIERYRATTISLDYYGDSIVNSVADALAMMAGFGLASRLPVAASVTLGVVFEVFTGMMIRDNLTLNVLMLVYPMEAIKAWQAAISL